MFVWTLEFPEQLPIENVYYVAIFNFLHVLNEAFPIFGHVLIIVVLELDIARFDLFGVLLVHDFKKTD